jgi:hypothetical protein
MTVSLDHPVRPARLRTVIGAMSGMIGASMSMSLMSIVEALERQLCLRSDDLEEAQRLGLLVQVARVRSHPAPRRRARRW